MPPVSRKRGSNFRPSTPLPMKVPSRSTRGCATGKARSSPFSSRLSARALWRRRAPCARRLTTAGILDVLPSHYFHITVLPVILANDLPAGSIARMMDRTSRALRGLPSLRLTLKGINSFPTSAFVEVHDERGGSDRGTQCTAECDDAHRHPRLRCGWPRKTLTSHRFCPI